MVAAAILNGRVELNLDNRFLLRAQFAIETGDFEFSVTGDKMLTVMANETDLLARVVGKRFGGLFEVEAIGFGLLLGEWMLIFRTKDHSLYLSSWSRPN